MQEATQRLSFSFPRPSRHMGGGNRSGATALLNSCNFLYFCPPPSSRVQAQCNALSSESAHHLKRAAPLSAPAETGCSCSCLVCTLIFGARQQLKQPLPPSSTMDLRLPPLPSLPPPNLISGSMPSIATGASSSGVVGTGAAAIASISAPEHSLPAYMQKLLQLQQLQEQASLPALPEPLAPAPQPQPPFASSGMQQPVSWNTLFDISGAELIASRSPSGAQPQRAAAFGPTASVSGSFEEVDEQ